MKTREPRDWYGFRPLIHNLLYLERERIAGERTMLSC